MIERMAQHARPILEFTPVRRTRRNHALEHATVHMLSRRIKKLRVAGRSTMTGFVLVGDVPTDMVEKAVAEAVERMNSGESSLAIHPNCGTNLVTTGAMTTGVGFIGLGTTNRRPSLDRLSWTMFGMMIAVLVSQPIGMSLQRHFTTKGDLGDLEVVKITRDEARWPFSSQPMVIHRIVTRRG